MKDKGRTLLKRIQDLERQRQRTTTGLGFVGGSSGGSGVTLPITEGDVTNLVSDLASITTDISTINGNITDLQTTNEFLVGSLDFASSSSGGTMSGLDGDTQIRYVLEWYFTKVTTSAYKIYCEINGDSGTNYGEAGTYALSTGVGGPLGAGGNKAFLLADNGGGISSAGDITSGKLEIWAKSGVYRMMHGVRTEWQGAPLVVHAISSTIWKNSADNLTSIKITSSVASEIAAGSWVRLWHRPIP